jgi:hypothetical protein
MLISTVLILISAISTLHMNNQLAKHHGTTMVTTVYIPELFCKKINVIDVRHEYSSIQVKSPNVMALDPNVNFSKNSSDMRLAPLNPPANPSCCVVELL